MDFNAEKQHDDEHGFVIVRQLPGRRDFTELQQHLERCNRDLVPTLPDTGALYQE